MDLRLALPLLLAALPAVAAAAPAPPAGPPTFRAAPPLQSASIRGELVDRATGRPVEAALVVLVDAGGQRRAAALTDAAGRFVLPVGTPGRYTLRAERVGYATDLSEPIEVAAGQTVAYRMTAGARNLSLDRITIRARARCELRPGEGTGTQLLWEEVRKALHGAAWAQEQGLFTFAVRRWKRDLEPGTLQVKSEELLPAMLTAASPFESAPAAELRDRGWVRQEGTEQVFFAPDAAALLSAEFLDGHCFRVSAHPSDTTRLGLRFEPVRGRRLPDVAGTLWVDRRSAALREMEYRYTGLEGDADHERVGGRVEFEQVPSGAWVVRRWVIRTPLVRENREVFLDRERKTQHLLAFREEGGEITEIRTRSGTPLRTTTQGLVEGVVFDSTRAAPLAGAKVFLSGTSYATEADSTGGFRLAGVPPGRYALSFSHPRLDTLAYLPPPAEAVVAENAATRVAVAVPSLMRVRTAACADSTGAVLWGTVQGGTGELGLPAARVTVSWPDPAAPREPRRQTRETDGAGAYLFCSLPAGVPLRVAAEFLGRRVAGATLSITPGAPREHAIRAELPERLRMAMAGQRVRVSGLLQGAGGAPAPTGTTVRLVPAGAAAEAEQGAARETRSDAQGRFAFDAVGQGQYRLEVADAALGTRTMPLAVVGGGEMEVDIQLSGASVQLDPLHAVARSRPRVEAARARASGRQLSRELLEERARRGGTLDELLGRMPGVVTAPGCVGLRSSGMDRDDLATGERSCKPMTVYIDGSPVLDGMETLFTFPLEQIESVEVQSRTEAMGRYGTAAENGVILITTRSTRRQ